MVTLVSVSGEVFSVDTAPIAEIVSHLNLDAGRFAEWAGSVFAEYHASQSFAKKYFPPAKETGRELSAYINALERVNAVLSSPGFRAGPESGILYQLLNTGANPREARNSRDAFRVTINTEIAAARQAQQAAKAAGGRPKADRRNGVLAAIVQELQNAGASAAAAREMAERIMIAGRVPVPTGERAIRRASGRGGKN